MATRLYFRENGSVAITPAVDATWNPTASPFLRAALANAPVAGDVLANISAVSTVGGVRCYRQYISLPMTAGHTFNTGVTYKCYAQARESAADDNIRSRLGVRIVSLDGTTVRHTVLAVADYSTATEWNTALRAKAFADGDAGVGSYVTVAGDRLVVEIGHADSAGVSITGTLRLGAEATGVTDLLENETATAATLRPWFETSLNLTFKGPVVGTIAGTSTTTGATRGRGRVAATVAGTSVTTGAARGRGRMVGTVAGTSTTTGALRGRGRAASSVAGTSATTGSLPAKGRISGAIAATSTVAGDLTEAFTASPIAGSAAGTSTVTGSLRGRGRVAGVITGTATVVGDVRGRGRIAATISATSTTAGALTARGACSGTAAGSCSVTGTLTDAPSAGAIEGATAGTSTAMAALTGRGRLAGTVAGTSTAAATLDMFTPPPTLTAAEAYALAERIAVVERVASEWDGEPSDPAATYVVSERAADVQRAAASARAEARAARERAEREATWARWLAAND